MPSAGQVAAHPVSGPLDSPVDEIRRWPRFPPQSSEGMPSESRFVCIEPSLDNAIDRTGSMSVHAKPVSVTSGGRVSAYRRCCPANR